MLPISRLDKIEILFMIAGYHEPRKHKRLERRPKQNASSTV